MFRVRELRASAACAAVAAAIAWAGPASAQQAGDLSVDPIAADAVPAARFFVRAIRVKGNTILPPKQIEAIVYPFMGPDKSADDVEQARAALQKAYEDRGYATVSVFIPEQSVDSGIIRLQVDPQRIGEVTVAGGDRTSRDWVLKRAPSLTPGQAPNFQDVQRDLVTLNQSADRKVTPEVKAGVAPGTIDVALNVEDGSPFHGSAELNNYSSASTTDLRAAATLRYDDLWGRGDSVSVSAQTAPRDTNDGTVFSANYLARLGKVQLLGYYVHSDSDIAVVSGFNVIGRGDLGGLRLIVPLFQRDGFYSSLTAGIDYKNFKEDAGIGENRSSAPIQYFPFTIGWRGDWAGERARTNLSLTTTFGIRGLGDDQPTFDFKRFNAKPNFFYLRADTAHTRDVWADIQLHAHLSGQYSGAPLISNEEFSVGGMDSVRGYFESETLGDFGFASQFEVRSPQLFSNIGLLDDLRLLAFADVGYSGIHDPLIGQTDYWLASVGGALRIKLFGHLSGIVDAGVPLKDGPDSESGEVFVKFRVLGEF